MQEKIKRYFKKLWKLLIDKDIKKSKLCEMAEITTNEMAKMGKDEMVKMDYNIFHMEWYI